MTKSNWGGKGSASTYSSKGTLYHRGNPGQKLQAGIRRQEVIANIVEDTALLLMTCSTCFLKAVRPSI